MRQDLLEAGSVFCVLSAVLVIVAQIFAVLYGLPLSFDGFFDNVSMAWEIAVFASLDMFSFAFIIPAIGSAYYYASKRFTKKKTMLLSIPLIGAIICSIALWSLLEAVRIGLGVFSAPRPEVIPAMMAISEGNYMVYLYFEAIGKMLLYGGGIGILSYLLKKSERPTPIVGISILTAILGVSAASVFLPGPFFDIFRFASILLPLFFAALYLGLGIVMLREQPIEESTESRGASLATISGLLGIAGVIIYFIFLLEVVSFARPDTLLVGWHTADIIGIGFYLALLLSVLLAIPSVFATWHEWNMNTSKTGIILQLLLTLAFVLLALSLGSLLVVLLLARGELWSSGGYLASSWFLNIYWLSIEAIMLQMVALVRTLFILGIGAFGLGISLISFHLLSRNSRGRIAYLSGAFGIILLALTGILLTEPPAAFPGVFGLVSIAVLSLYGIVGGIVLTKKTYPSERIEDSVLEATQIEEGQSQ